MNEWIRKKKKMDWGEGRGGLCRMGGGFERVGRLDGNRFTAND